jgi:ankyrin repeat protein
LISYGADVNGQDGTGKTPIFYATMNADVKIARLLLTNKANVKDNPELLSIAVKEEYREIVELLLQHGADVNRLYKSTYRTGYMPLHVATKHKQEEVAKLLIGYGADVNGQDETGKTPIFYATENGDVKITRLLLTNKANVKDNPELLCAAVRGECREIVEILLQRGADVNASDKCGRTALCFTAVRSHLSEDRDGNVKGEIAKLLLSRGANVNAQTKNGVTTLHAAAQKGCVKVIEALLEYNADVNSTVETDRKLLHIAAEYGHLEVVKVLLKFGTNIDSKDEDGRTALHIACKREHKNIVTALLEHGSDVNIMSRDNRTALDIAVAIPRTFEFLNYDSEDGYYYDDDDDDDGCFCVTFVYCNEIIAGILKHHMVKMKTANLYVSKKNLRSISYGDETTDFQNECEKEITSMKSEMIGNANVSFYDILTKGTNQLAMYAGNESIVQVLKSDDYKRDFLIYAGMINCNFRKGERRKELLEQGNKIFHFHFNLPRDCTDKIFSYLSDEDLRICNYALKLVSNQQA